MRGHCSCHSTKGSRGSAEPDNGVSSKLQPRSPLMGLRRSTPSAWTLASEALSLGLPGKLAPWAGLCLGSPEVGPETRIQIQSRLSCPGRGSQETQGGEWRMGQVGKAAGQQLGRKPAGDLWEMCRAAPKLTQQWLQVPRQAGCPRTVGGENRADFRHGAPRASGLKLRWWALSAKG